MTKVAVLDDWQGVARNNADWSKLQARADVVFFAKAFENEDDAARQESPGREHAEAEGDGPKPRQHPQAVAGEAGDHHRQQPAGDEAGDELVGDDAGNLRLQRRARPAAAQHHLRAHDHEADQSRHAPEGQVGVNLPHRIGNPLRLNCCGTGRD